MSPPVARGPEAEEEAETGDENGREDEWIEGDGWPERDVGEAETWDEKPKEDESKGVEREE